MTDDLGDAVRQHDLTIDDITRTAHAGFDALIAEMKRSPSYLIGERYLGDQVAPGRFVYNQIDSRFYMRCVGMLEGGHACTDQWEIGRWDKESGTPFVDDVSGLWMRIMEHFVAVHFHGV